VVFEVAVGVLTETFITSYPHSGEAVSVARMIIGRLVVGCEESRQSFPGSDALCWEIVEPWEWCFAHHKGEVSRHVVFIASRGACCNAIHLLHILGSERPSYSSMAGSKSLGYLIVRRCRENAGKLLTAPRLADRA
jgi:hypothetical protein